MRVSEGLQMTEGPTIEEQEAAWFEYVDLKRRADAAFARFRDLFLAEDMAAGRIVERRPAANVEIFPVHRTRPPRCAKGSAR